MTNDATATPRKLKVVECMKEEVEELENLLAQFAKIVMGNKDGVLAGHLEHQGRTYRVSQVVERNDNCTVIEITSEGEESTDYIDQVNVFFEHVRRVREV